jgi:Zn-dependent protease
VVPLLGLPHGLDLVFVFIGFTVLVASLSVHEAAHAWTADRLGDPTARMLGRVSLNPARHVDLIGTIAFPLIALLTRLPIIGWARPVPVNTRNFRNPRRDYVVVAAAGPVSNLLLAGVGAFIWQFMAAGLSERELSELLVGPLPLFVLLLIEVNVLLAVFNMIPVPPLDGGNVLGGLLPDRLAVEYDRLRPYGILILYVLMLTGALGRFIEPVQRAILAWMV